MTEEEWGARATRLVGAARTVLRCVTGRGWSVLVIAVAAGAAANWLGWRELVLLAWLFALVVGLSCLLTAGRSHLEVRLSVEPRRLVAGGSAGAELTVTNRSRWPLLAASVELPAGTAVGRFALPVLRSGESHVEVAVIPTYQRGVVTVGPATSQRGDPFGLVSRELSWARAVELFVHPVTVPIAPIGTGLLRDLEGQTTADMSTSDLAFHTLREYTAGDDYRHIHWKSSAKLQGSGRSTEFLVRQFQDTRRFHVAVVVDTDPARYRTVEEFETAMSVAASVARRTVVDEMDLTVVAGTHSAVRAPAPSSLDVFARATADQTLLPASASRAFALSPDVSAAVLVTGSLTELGLLRQSALQFGGLVTVVALQLDDSRPPSVRPAESLVVATVGGLPDLARVLRGVARI